MTYQEFLEKKLRYNTESGFDIHEDFLNPKLFDFQKYIFRKALRAGKYALFVECGGGKTPMQLEWANQVFRNTTLPVVILCPLAVSGQTIEEGLKFGYDVRRIGEGESSSGIYITNYEQLEKYDFGGFGGVVLDESSILKNFNGATKKKLLDTFACTPFLGIGSEVYQALKMGRKGIGIELKESYFKIAQRNCKNAHAEKYQLSLF